MKTADDKQMSPAAVAALVSGLQEWARFHDLHVQAAVWLLCTHDVWPRRPEFRKVCRHSGEDWWIDWSAARAAFDTGGFDRSSSTERAVLDLVITLGQDRYRFSRMGADTSRAVVEAVRHALGGQR